MSKSNARLKPYGRGQRFKNLPCTPRLSVPKASVDLTFNFSQPGAEKNRSLLTNITPLFLALTSVASVAHKMLWELSRPSAASERVPPA